MLDIVSSNIFKKDLKLAIKRGYNIELLDKVVNNLAMQKLWKKNTKTTNWQVSSKTFGNAT